MTSLPASARAEHLGSGLKPIWDGEAELADAHWHWYTPSEFMRAETLATLVAVALRLDEKRRGTLAADLQTLFPGTLKELPGDPISGGSFEYADTVGGQKVLRSGAVVIGQETTPHRVEILV